MKKRQLTSYLSQRLWSSPAGWQAHFKRPQREESPLALFRLVLFPSAAVQLAAADRSRRQRTTRGVSSPCLRSRLTTGEPHDKWRLRKPAGWRAGLIGLLRLAPACAETRLPMYQARASEASPSCRRQPGCCCLSLCFPSRVFVIRYVFAGYSFPRL